jgi:hypothetical protein
MENKIKVGDVWLIAGGCCQDLVQVIEVIEGGNWGYIGISVDCSDHPGVSGYMSFNEDHLVRKIEGADGK